MSSNPLLWIGLGTGLVLLVVIVFYNMPRAKAVRVRRTEEYQRQERERQKEKEARVAREARRMENFRKQQLVIYIREKDGRKSSFEAILIGTLLENGIPVQVLSDNDGRAIANADAKSFKDGVLALVGTTWRKEKTSPYRILSNGACVPPRQYEVIYCDYRLLSASGDVVNVIRAGCPNCEFSTVKSLANYIFEDIATGVDWK